MSSVNVPFLPNPGKSDMDAVLFVPSDREEESQVDF